MNANFGKTFTGNLACLGNLMRKLVERGKTLRLSISQWDELTSDFDANSIVKYSIDGLSRPSSEQAVTVNGLRREFSHDLLVSNHCKKSMKPPSER